MNQNEAYYLVAEYNDKKALAELGYTFDGEKLDDYSAAAFVKIAGLYDKEFTKGLPKGKGK